MNEKKTRLWTRIGSKCF